MGEIVIGSTLIAAALLILAVTALEEHRWQFRPRFIVTHFFGLLALSVFMLGIGLTLLLLHLCE